MILASGPVRFLSDEPGPHGCRIMTRHPSHHAKTSPSHSPAAGRARVPNFCTLGRSGARVVCAFASDSQLVTRALAGQRASWPHRGWLLVPVGQLECGGGQVAPAPARVAGPFIPQGIERLIDTHQGAKPGAMIARHGGCHASALPKKKGPDRGSGPFKVLVPLVGFELTTYRLQGGCSTN